MKLPTGIDYTWLACDAEGFVARFTNAGEGPIPVAILAIRQLADRAEVLTREMPISGGYKLQVSVPGPVDFIRTARCGLYVFDWQIARKAAGQSGRYEIACLPLRPVQVNELHPEIKRLAELVRFEGIQFSEAETICVSDLIDCVE